MTERSLAQRKIECPNLNEWIGTANDVGARFVTFDKTVEAYVHPVLTRDIKGLDLKDQNGDILASAWVSR